MVISAKIISYKKYGLSENVEKKYLFSHGGLNIDFGIMDLDQNRKLMILNLPLVSSWNTMEIFTILF